MRKCILSIPLLAALTGPSCVDITPIDYVAPENTRPDGGSVVPGDGGDGGVSLIEACRECMTSGGCETPTEGCNGDPKCAIFLDCVLDLYCLNFSLTDLAHLPPCTAECSAAAGIAGASDPAANLLGPIVLCAQDPARCGNVCNVR